jgi:uncharacterized protein YbaP (TraB family)
MKKLFFALSLLFYFSVSAQYNSLLWKISGNGLQKPSYLFGTMHTAERRVLGMSDAAIPYFAETGAYAMELDPKESFNLSMVSKLMMGKGHSLKAMIPEREYQMLDSIVKQQVGFSLKLFDNIAPIFVMTILQTANIESGDSSEKGEQVLDLFFYERAKKEKKKTLGIETVDEQIDALNALSYQEQADMLVEELRKYESREDVMQDMVRYYLNQNLDSLLMLNDEEPMPEKFYKALITDRNRRMANRIADFTAKQQLFIAIGALHLPGEKGVIELLRKKGFLVEAVK